MALSSPGYSRLVVMPAASFKRTIDSHFCDGPYTILALLHVLQLHVLVHRSQVIASGTSVLTLHGILDMHRGIPSLGVYTSWKDSLNFWNFVKPMVSLYRHPYTRGSNSRAMALATCTFPSFASKPTLLVPHAVPRWDLKSLLFLLNSERI